MKSLLIILIWISVAEPVFCTENTDFNQCLESQQQAIADLIQALKDAQKVIMQSNKGAPPADSNENPFKDKQKYNLPEMKKENNPESRLEQIREKQQSLLDDAKKSGNDEKTRRQGEISGKLEKMAGDGKLPKSSSLKLESAASASCAAEKALESNENEIAKAMGQKSLSEIKKTLSEIREQSDKAVAEAGGEIIKSLNAAQREMRNNNRAKTAAAINDALKKAAGEAKKQLETGRFSNAEKINGIAKKLGASQDKLLKADVTKAGEELDRIKKEISLAMKTSEAQHGMRENVEKMRELVKELKYLERNPSATAAGDRRKVFEDMQLTAHRIGEYSQDLTGGYMQPAAEMYWLMDEILSKDATAEKIKNTFLLAEKIIERANIIMANAAGGKQLNLFSAEEAPAEYRKAVSKYFERLSESGNGKNTNK